MNVRDGTERKVSFNTRDELGDKIDKLTVVMSSLTAKDSHEIRPFKPQIYKRIGLIIREVIRTGQIVGTGDNIQAAGPDRTIETVIFKETLEGMKDKIIEEDIEMIDIMIIIEAGTDQEKGHSQETIVAEIEV